MIDSNIIKGIKFISRSGYLAQKWSEIEIDWKIRNIEKIVKIIIVIFHVFQNI